MIYTCHDMIRDCRANKPEGWSHFITHYVPVIRRLLAHYSSDEPELLERALLDFRKPESSLFHSVDPSPERWFVAELRQKLVACTETADLTTLPPLTQVEKQVVWLETMRYGAEDSAVIMKMSPATVESIRGKAPALPERATPPSKSEACLPAKDFLDVIDGRSNWYRRDEMDRHVNTCWYCIDHFCRLREVCEVLRRARPLTEDEAAPFRKLLGVPAGKSPLWNRLLRA